MRSPVRFPLVDEDVFLQAPEGLDHLRVRQSEVHADPVGNVVHAPLAPDDADRDPGFLEFPDRLPVLLAPAGAVDQDVVGALREGELDRLSESAKSTTRTDSKFICSEAGLAGEVPDQSGAQR